MKLSTAKDLMTLTLMKSVIIKDDTEQLLFQKEIECQLSIIERKFSIYFIEECKKNAEKYLWNSTDKEFEELISKYPNGLSSITKIDFRGIEE
tara:strand:+ start:400 stop:678 length:279 start_codon:yes stop_codon:yes gene_type:complete